MAYLILRSYFMLVAVDLALRSSGLKSAYRIVRKSKPIAENQRVSYEPICKAMDLACVFYPNTVPCLQRSVAGVALLREYGWPAEFVTGCSISTFENHAWAELDGLVVSDKPYMHEMYQVLDRS